MKPYVILLCIGAVIFVLVLPIQLRIRRNMRRYWDRACTGFQWRRRFPDAPKSDIRSFLELFVDAFAFRHSRRLCFSPDDKVMEVYRTLYPDRFMADALELETLASLLRKKYGIDAATFWREDITLGEVFTHTRVV
jgi:hypothetical protein